MLKLSRYLNILKSCISTQSPYIKLWTQHHQHQPQANCSLITNTSEAKSQRKAFVQLIQLLHSSAHWLCCVHCRLGLVLTAEMFFSRRIKWYCRVNLLSTLVLESTAVSIGSVPLETISRYVNYTRNSEYLFSNWRTHIWMMRLVAWLCLFLKGLISKWLSLFWAFNMEW